MLRCLSAVLERRPARMRGGYSRRRYFSGSRLLSSIRPGRHFIRCTMRIALTGLVEMAPTICRPFSRRKFFIRHSAPGWPATPGGEFSQVVAGVADFLAGIFGFVGAGGFPLHLLLLPRRVLQSVLGRSAELRRRRAAPGLSRRTLFPLILQNVHRYFMYLAVIFIFILGSDAWKAMWFTENGDATFRHRRGNDRADVECHSAGQLHVWLPFAAAFDRRFSGRAVKKAGVCEKLCLRQLPQPPPHALGVAEFVLGRVYRCLCPALRQGTWHDIVFFKF